MTHSPELAALLDAARAYDAAVRSKVRLASLVPRETLFRAVRAWVESSPAPQPVASTLQAVKITEAMVERAKLKIGGFVVYDDRGGPDTEVLADLLPFNRDAEEMLTEIATAALTAALQGDVG